VPSVSVTTTRVPKCIAHNDKQRPLALLGVLEDEDPSEQNESERKKMF